MIFLLEYLGKTYVLPVIMSMNTAHDFDVLTMWSLKIFKNIQHNNKRYDVF